jgi:glutamine amidotransferase
MPSSDGKRVAIVDYGMGNLFSVRQACEYVGLQAIITSSAMAIQAADAVILPGVGAFGDAMNTLTRLDLVGVIRDAAQSPKPLVGICLGMQLLMSESQEFGQHRGLGIIEGEVLPMQSCREGARPVKVPQVGWNQIQRVASECQQPCAGPKTTFWNSPLLQGLANGEYMYFVHSFYPVPQDSNVVRATTQHGPTTFCSSLRLENVFGFQFHPERSGLAGLHIYDKLADKLTTPGL